MTTRPLSRSAPAFALARRYSVLLASVLLLVLAACGDQGKAGDPGQDGDKGQAAGKGDAASPQSVFEAAQKARDANDMAGMLAHVTPKSLDAITFWGFLTASSIAQGHIGPKKHLIEALKPIFAKHGVKFGRDGPEGSDGVAAALKGKAVAFLEDVAGVDPDLAKGLSSQVDGQLADVGIDGASATAWIATTKAGLETRTGLAFELIDGSWKMVLDPLGMLGERPVQVGGAGKMPEANYPGATVANVPPENRMGVTGTTARFLGSAADGAKIIEWYKAELPKTGWKPAKASRTVSADGSVSWLWTNEQRVLWVNVQSAESTRNSSVGGKSLADFVQPGDTSVLMLVEGHSTMMAIYARLFDL